MVSRLMTRSTASPNKVRRPRPRRRRGDRAQIRVAWEWPGRYPIEATRTSRTTCASSSGPTSAPAAASARRASSSRARACSRRALIECPRWLCRRAFLGSEAPWGGDVAVPAREARRDVAAEPWPTARSPRRFRAAALMAPVCAHAQGRRPCPAARRRPQVTRPPAAAMWRAGGEGGDRLPPIG